MAPIGEKMRIQGKMVWTLTKKTVRKSDFIH